MEDESNLDLDIDNYSINELKKFFNINSSDTKSEIEKKMDSVIQKCLSTNDKNYNSETKKKLYNFLENSKKKINLELTIYDKNSTIDYNIAAGMPHFPLNIQNISKKYVNPTDVQNVTRLLLFNSGSCDNILTLSSTTQSLTFTLPRPIRDVISSRLSLFQFYNIQYTFSARNRNNILEIIDASYGAKTIIIPDGTYTSTEFPQVVEQQINLAFSGYYYLTTAGITPSFPETLDPSYLLIAPGYQGDTPLENRYAVTINPYNYKTTIFNTKNVPFTMVFDKPTWYDNATSVCGLNNALLDPELYFLNSILRDQTFGYQCGYRNIIYRDSTTYTSESVYSQQLFDYIYVSIDDHNINSTDRVVGVLPNNFLDNKFMGVIPITAQQFSYGIDTGANFVFKSRTFTGPVNISKIDVQLYGPFGQFIPLNLTSFSFGLELIVQYTNPFASNADAIGAQQLL